MYDKKKTNEQVNIMEIKDEVLQKIKELLPQAPSYWADVIAAKMKKTPDMVRRISKGQRGMRKGAHKEVLRFLVELLEKENESTRKIIDRAKSIESLNKKPDGKDE